MLQSKAGVAERVKRSVPHFEQPPLLPGGSRVKPSHAVGKQTLNSEGSHMADLVKETPGLI